MKNMPSNLFVGRDCISGRIVIASPRLTTVFDYFVEHEFIKGCLKYMPQQAIQKAIYFYGDDWQETARKSHYIFNEIFKGELEIQIAQFYN